MGPCMRGRNRAHRQHIYISHAHKGNTGCGSIGPANYGTEDKDGRQRPKALEQQERTGRRSTCLRLSDVDQHLSRRVVDVDRSEDRSPVVCHADASVPATHRLQNFVHAWKEGTQGKQIRAGGRERGKEGERTGGRVAFLAWVANETKLPTKRLVYARVKKSEYAELIVGN